MGIIVDIPRQITPEEGKTVASWVIDSYGDGTIALGLGGPEIGNPPEKFQTAFDKGQSSGLLTPAILRGYLFQLTRHRLSPKSNLHCEWLP